MKRDDEFDKCNRNRSLSPTPNDLPQRDHQVILFTGTAVLLKMKQTLGLEAMLEYMEEFFRDYKARHPLVQEAVKLAVSQVSVRTLYREAVNRETR